jgi:uncharacterized protein YlxW (UPF0749 family)
MSNWQDIGVALVSALTGGGFIKLTESWLTRNKNRSEQDKQFRDELRGEAESLRKQIDALKVELKNAEKELDDFKEKYWKVYTEYKQFRFSVYAILLANGLDPKQVLPPDEMHGA